MNRYDTLVLELLRRIDENTKRIATALEKTPHPSGQDREAIEKIVDERVKKMFSDFPNSSSHTRAW